MTFILWYSLVGGKDLDFTEHDTFEEAVQTASGQVDSEFTRPVAIEEVHDGISVRLTQNPEIDRLALEQLKRWDSMKPAPVTYVAAVTVKTPEGLAIRTRPLRDLFTNLEDAESEFERYKGLFGEDRVVFEKLT